MLVYILDEYGEEVASSETQFEINVRNDSALRSIVAHAVTLAANASAVTSGPEWSAEQRQSLAAAAAAAAAARDDLEWLLRLPWAEKRVYRSARLPKGINRPTKPQK